MSSHQLTSQRARHYILWGSVGFLIVAALLYFGSRVVAPRLAKHLPNLPYAPKTIEKLDRQFIAEIKFNNEQNQTPFTPVITTALRSAAHSIDLAMYSIDTPILRDELYAATRRGVTVRIIVPANKSEQHKRLFTNIPQNVSITTVGKQDSSSPDASLMHHKFVLIDANTTQPTVITGSVNWTKLQELFDPSFLLITHDQTVATLYEEEFNRLKSGASGVTKVRTSGYRPWAAQLAYKNGTLEIWWSPGVGEHTIKRRLIDLIASAQHSIDVMVWQITDRDIANALILKAAQGIPVRIITDDFNAWRNSSVVPMLLQATQSITRNTLEILDDTARTIDFSNTIKPYLPSNQPDFNSFFHHHAILVDKTTLLAGTNNWSYQANYRNDESAFVTTVPNLVQSYQSSFDYHYRTLRGRLLDATILERTLHVKSAKAYQGNKLAVVSENIGNPPSATVCYDTALNSNEISTILPVGCKNHVLNVYVVRKNGEVIANKLIGTLAP